MKRRIELVFSFTNGDRDDFRVGEVESVPREGETVQMFHDGEVTSHLVEAVTWAYPVADQPGVYNMAKPITARCWLVTP